MRQEKAVEWAALLRRDVLEMAQAAPSPESFPVSVDWAQSSSVADILAVLYLEILQHRPEHPAWPDRDRFVFSKKSAWPAFASLLFRLGYSDRPPRPEDPQDMNSAAGVDYSAACDGTGLSAAVGMALGLRLDAKSNRVFALLESPELGCGRTWEAAEWAGKERLSKLCAIVDLCAAAHPSVQTKSVKEDGAPGKAVAEKFHVFGWDTIVVDGHALDELRYGFSKFKKNTTGRPFVIVAQTLLGQNHA